MKYEIDSSAVRNKTPMRIGAGIALALVAGLIAWIVIERGDDEEPATTTTAAATTPSTAGPAGTKAPVGPVAVAATGLSALAAKSDQPVYWAGEIAEQRYEFTQTSAGRVYVRYLPQGVEAGDKRAIFLIVATYPFPNAYRALKQVAKGNEVEIPGGGIALVDQAYPKSVHFAFPGAAYQGEVYDASPEKALAVATSGDIQPVP